MKTALVLIGTGFLFGGVLLGLGMANLGTFFALVLLVGMGIGVAIPEDLKI